MPGLQATWWDAACAEALSDEAFLAAMLRFEGALALASAEAGLFPAPLAQRIARVCEAWKPDAPGLAVAARQSAVLTIPFVKQLTAEVARSAPEAARWVHYGATSQDVVDTALVLCLREAGTRLGALVQRTGEACAALTAAHARTPMMGRTVLQSAVPLPFGFKAAGWLAMLTRSRAQFAHAMNAASLLQFGGPVGTLSAFSTATQGQRISVAMAAQLGLATPSLSWHSARDGLARLGAEIAILAGVAGKVARDVSLMMQPEIGEVFEPAAAGRGGSSAMPHKRNPVGCVTALEAAQRTPGLAASLLSALDAEHERGLGQWQGQLFVFRDLACSAANGVAAMAEVLEGLRVEPAAMRANIERLGGLAFSEAVAVALSEHMGKAAAHALTESLCTQSVREGIPLEQAIRAHPQALDALGEASLAGLFDPAACYGDAPGMIERALADWHGN